MNGLGRGLSSLIPVNNTAGASTSSQSATSQPVTIPIQKTAAAQTTDGLQHILVSSIVPNPQQPRLHFDQQALQDLADSIQRYGVLEPVIVTPDTDRPGHYILIAGERRLRACQQLQLNTIPALVRTATELERLELALIENVQRQDLNPIERAKSYQRLISEFGLTQAQAATKIGIARSSLANILRLLELPPVVQLGLSQGTISEGHAKVLLSLPTEAEQLAVYDELVRGSLTVRQTEQLVAHRQTSTPPTKGKKTTKGDRLPTEWVLATKDLQQRWNAPVSIRPKGQNGAQLIFEGYSTAEVNSLLKRLLGGS